MDENTIILFDNYEEFLGSLQYINDNYGISVCIDPYFNSSHSMLVELEYVNSENKVIRLCGDCLTCHFHINCKCYKIHKIHYKQLIREQKLKRILNETTR